MREIVLDTETTGLDPDAGHRLVELACVELINHVPSGREFHRHVNPQRDMPEEAFAIHGLSAEFLAKHPTFDKIVESFFEFIADSPLIIHNADFDLKFLNAELKRAGRESILRTRAIDTVALARQKYPGAPASLDALCKRFEIDLSARTKHGALLDSQLLAEVYLELVGGRQPDLDLSAEAAAAAADAAGTAAPLQFRAPRPHAPSAAELAAHETFLAKLKEPIWNRG